MCVFCEDDEQQRWERGNRMLRTSAVADPTGRQTIPMASRLGGTAKGTRGEGNIGLAARGHDGWGAGHAGVTPRKVGNELGNGDWLCCLRRLYAAVPPEWLSTVELVLEQTLHQMPDVAESLLDSIGRSRRGGAESSPVVEGRDHYPFSAIPVVDGAPASMAHDLSLVLLLLREASPLRTCSLPVLPEGVDRGRRAEQSIRSLLQAVARWGFQGGRGKDAPSVNSTCLRGTFSSGTTNLNTRTGRDGALLGVRILLSACLRTEAEFIGRGSASGSGGSTSVGDVIAGDGWELSAIASERASQLLELALRWLEEGSGSGAGGNGMGTAGHGACLEADDLASETILVVFDAVPGARPRLLRALLGGVVDRSLGGAVCSRSYMRAWEGLMAQEAKQKVRSWQTQSVASPVSTDTS